MCTLAGACAGWYFSSNETADPEVDKIKFVRLGLRGVCCCCLGGMLVLGLTCGCCMCRVRTSGVDCLCLFCACVRGCAEPTAVRGVVVAVPHGAVPPGLDCVRVVADRDDPVRSCGHALPATSRGEDDDESHREGAVCVRPVLFEVLPDDRGSGDSQHVHLCK